MLLFLMMQKIILASQSPRRKQLLEWAEIPFEVVVQNTDESYPESIPVAEVVIHIARNKAVAVYQSNYSFYNSVILAADTIVVLKNKIIGKPKNREDAINIL
ncbi:MAG: Maf family protein, partial [Parafilimonas sp.]